MNELSTERIMTVKEVAEALTCSIDLIQKKVKEYFPEIVENGKTTYLNEIQVTKIKLDIEKNPYLRQSSEVKTDLEKALLIKQAMQFQDEIIESLQKENADLKQKVIEDKPKVEFFDTVTESLDAIDMGQAAKVLNLGIGRNQLFEFLRGQSVLMSDNLPFQKYIDCGYFRVIEKKYSANGEPHINFKTVVYQTGLSYIKTLWNKQSKAA